METQAPTFKIPESLHELFVLRQNLVRIIGTNPIDVGTFTGILRRLDYAIRCETSRCLKAFTPDIVLAEHLEAAAMLKLEEAVAVLKLEEAAAVLKASS